MREIAKRKRVSLLDLGAGKGIGGIALAKALKERGVSVNLVMIDVRRDAVEASVRFAREEGIEGEARVMDATKAHVLGKFDLVLMYGAMLAHFDSWQLPRLFASAAALTENGVVIVEEMDRVDYIFRRGFKDLLVENPRPSEISVSVHVGYDAVRGSYRRAFIRLRNGEAVTLPVSFRSIATIASILWLFVSDVDIVLKEPGGMYFILGKAPRGLLEPDCLASDPLVLRRGKAWNPYHTRLCVSDMV